MKKENQEDNLFRIERRRQILSKLLKNGKLMVNETAEEFGVSGATIRQDLNELEVLGYLTRTHGGAIGKGTTMTDIPLSQRNAQQLPQKQAIARMALQLVESHDNLVLDGGTTIQEFATLLLHSNRTDISVITNFLPNLIILEGSQSIRMLSLGGSYDETLRSFVGPLAIEALSSFQLDKAFISTTGVSIRQGLSCTSFQDAEIRRAILAKAGQRILLADSSKINKSAFITVASMKDIDVFVTDWGISNEDHDAFTKAGVNVIIAPEGE
jgi:DeoR family fructose operon transcriptional repressor